MANCCFVWMDYRFKDPAKAAEFKEKLIKNKKEADKKEEGFYFGSDRKWMFDGDVTMPEQDWVRVLGWVKYSLEDVVFISALKYAGIDDLKHFEVLQDEESCEVYGRLEWEGGETFTSQFVKSEDWPQMPDDMTDEETDDWYDGLEDKLDGLLNKAEKVVVSFSDAEAIQDSLDKVLDGMRPKGAN